MVAAGIDHPNVIPIYDAGEVDGQLYIAMRYVEGFDLATLLRREGRLDLARTLAIMTQVAGALDAAHACGLVHRDVKPSKHPAGPGGRRRRRVLLPVRLRAHQAAAHRRRRRDRHRPAGRQRSLRRPRAGRGHRGRRAHRRLLVRVAPLDAMRARLETSGQFAGVEMRLFTGPGGLKRWYLTSSPP
jgi:Protein kinase domain